MAPPTTQHTVVVKKDGRPAGMRRRVYRLTVGRGRSAVVRRFSEDSVTLGSHDGNQLVVAHPTVSRFHARLELDPVGYLLSDLDSTNGTFVDGLRVLGAYLEKKARLGLGEVEVGFEVERNETELGLSRADRFGALLGASPAMRRLFDDLEKLAQTDTTVLLQGETGAGKDLVATEIHRHGPWRDGPFVVVDCGGLPDALVEAELFGHERGAFTGADQARAGAFEEAHGGTLFLDEIAELPPPVQTKLLRALESRAVKRLGSSDWKKVDVRVIAATHQDLARLCNQRLFREDLYFRLAVVTVRIPPLRDRLEDLPILCGAILDELGAGGSFIVDEALYEVLRGRRWAGNIRELRNVLQRALVLGPHALAGSGDDESSGAPSEEPFKIAKARAVEDFEKKFLVDLLTRCGGNVAQAARAAEVDPAWVFRLVKRHKIDVAAMRARR